MTRCNLQAHIVALADGSLNADMRHEMEAHLALCPHCQAEHAALRELDALCGEFIVAPAADYNFDDLLRRMAAIDPIDEIVHFLPRLRLRAGVPRVAVAFMLLLFSGGILSLFRQGRQVYAAQRDSVARYADKVEERLDSVLDPTAPDPDDPRVNARV